MHIPDNYLSPSTCAVITAVMIPVWKRASSKVKEELTKKKMPLLGICAAFSFVIMMFNIPLPGGTSGHAIGSVLAAILLGPNAAVVSITIALAIQALFFGDGGILAFGVNCFNMAFIMPFSGYYIYRIIKSRFKGVRGQYLSAFIAGYISINLAAFAAAIEFGIQPVLFRDLAGLPLYCPYSLSTTLPAMLLPHLLLAGFVEGGITAAVLGYIIKVSPSLVHQDRELKAKPLLTLIFSMAVLTPLGLFATGTAFGEWDNGQIKSMIGYVPSGMKNGIKLDSLMADYSINGIPAYAAYIISAVAGIVLIMFLVRLLFTRNSKKEESIH